MTTTITALLATNVAIIAGLTSPTTMSPPSTSLPIGSVRVPFGIHKKELLRSLWV